jgi:hypothetical protein
MRPFSAALEKSRDFFPERPKNAAEEPPASPADGLGALDAAR